MTSMPERSARAHEALVAAPEHEDVVAPGEVGHDRWPSCSEVLRDDAAAQLVIEDDRGQAAALEVAHREDDRRAALRDRSQQLGVAVARDRDDEAVDPPAGERPELAAQADGVVARLDDDGELADGLERLADAPQQRTHERVAEVGDEHAERAAATALEAARHEVDGVAELLGGLDDARGGAAC